MISIENRARFAADAFLAFKLGGSGLVAVRVFNRQGMGGIWKPVALIASDVEAEADALVELVVPNFVLVDNHSCPRKLLRDTVPNLLSMLKQMIAAAKQIGERPVVYTLVEVVSSVARSRVTSYPSKTEISLSS